MPRSLKLYITLLVALGAAALAATSIVYGLKPAIRIDLDANESASAVEVVLGLGFWTAVTALASALPVRMPRGILVTV